MCEGWQGDEFKLHSTLICTMQVDQQHRAEQNQRLRPGEQHGLGRPVYSVRQLINFTAMSHVSHLIQGMRY